MKKNKTTYFIFPFLELRGEDLELQGFINSYLGNSHYCHIKNVEIDWGDNLFLSFHKDLLYPDLKKKLEEHKFYKETFDEPDDVITFVYDFPEPFKEKVVDPFIKGDYSKINRAYQKKHFPESSFTKIADGVYTPEESLVSKVFRKAPELRKVLEDRLDVTLDDNVELWSRPEKEDEIYGYQKEIKPNSSPLDKNTENDEYNNQSDDEEDPECFTVGYPDLE